jgi:hypothetical protein
MSMAVSRLKQDAERLTPFYFRARPGGRVAARVLTATGGKRADPSIDRTFNDRRMVDNWLDW